MALQHLRSSTAHKRPIPTVMSAGQIAINTNEASPALFFKDSNGDLVKVGPVHIGTDAPNSSPASVAATALVTGTVYQILTVGTSDFTLVGASANTVGTIFTATGTTTGTGTVSGQQGVEKGEMWLDTTGGAYDLKIYDGTSWRSQAGEFVNVTGDTMTGDLVMNNADIVFEGATADDFETTLTVTDPTADRTITLPDVTGTVVTTGDTGSVTSTMILDGTIVNADVNASAAIAGTKIDPDFGSQNVVTTGTSTAASFIPTSSTVPTNGVYLPSANNVALATNGTGRLFVDANGDVGVGATSVDRHFHVEGTDNVQGKFQNNSTLCLVEFEDSNTTAGNRPTLGSTGDNFSFRTGGSESLRITSDGKVGVGTSSPDRILDIESAGSAEIKLTDSTNIGRDMYIKNNDGAFEFRAKDRNSDGSFAFLGYGGNVDNEFMRIDSSGNVGIGTTSPQYILHLHKNDGLQNYLQITNATTGSSATDGALFGLNDNEDVIVWQREAGALQFGTNNAERARIDSSGRLLVGTSSTSAVVRAVFEATSGGSGGGTVLISRGTATPTTNQTLGEIYFADSNHGQSAVIAARRDSGTWTSGSSQPTRLEFSTTADGDPSPTERMRITSEGYLLVNATSNASNGMIAIEYARGTSAGMRIQDTVGSGGTGVIADFYNSSGTSVGAITHNSSNTTYSTTSDYRVKENIESLTGATDRLLQLNPCRFNFTEAPDFSVDGFIAHEVQTIVPEAVVGEKDAVNEDGTFKLQGIDQSKLVPLLTAALQEALAKIENLEARLTAAGI